MEIFPAGKRWGNMGTSWNSLGCFVIPRTGRLEVFPPDRRLVEFSKPCDWFFPQERTTEHWRFQCPPLCSHQKCSKSRRFCIVALVIPCIGEPKNTSTGDTPKWTVFDMVYDFHKHHFFYGWCLLNAPRLNENPMICDVEATTSDAIDSCGMHRHVLLVDRGWFIDWHGSVWPRCF